MSLGLLDLPLHMSLLLFCDNLLVCIMPLRALTPSLTLLIKSRLVHASPSTAMLTKPVNRGLTHPPRTFNVSPVLGATSKTRAGMMNH